MGGSWGGNLELLENPFEEQCRSVLPLASRAVIFDTTEASWHGFRKIQLPPEINTSRRSIAVYFYTKEAPAQGAAPSHATFYYRRPLPGHLRPGHTLTEAEADVKEMQGFMARRDSYIRFLFEHEMEFTETLGKVIHSPTFLFAARVAKAAKFVFRGKD